MAIHYMDFYVTGIKGYPAGNMSRWVYELVDRAAKELPNWTEIRMDSDLFSYAFSEQTQISENEIEWIGKERIGDIKFLGQIWGSGLDWQDFGIIRKTEADSMDYKIVGNEYTSPDFDADLFAREMIAKCAEMDIQWQQIRMDENGRVYAFTQSEGVYCSSTEWKHGDESWPSLLTCLDGDEVSWQDFGIIRKTEADSMNYKIVGLDGYKPHPSHMESIAAGLVSDATARCEDWKEIRIDRDGVIYAYDTLPYADKRGWDFDDEDSSCFRLTDLSTELEVGLNWATFGIIRTEEAEVENTFLATSDWYAWKAQKPERTIAERQLWADEFASMIFAEVRDMTKTPDITNERIALLWTAIDELGERVDELGTKTPETVNAEEAEIDAEKFTAKLSEYELFEWRARNVRKKAGPTVWQNAHVEQPERTIADITNERIALLWTAIDELRRWFDELETKTPDTVNTEEAEEDAPELIRLPENLWQHAHVEQPRSTLTPDLITALSDWPDSALETIAQAIADGRIVLQ